MKQNHDMAETFEGMELIEETLLNNINGAGTVESAIYRCGGCQTF